MKKCNKSATKMSQKQSQKWVLFASKKTFKGLICESATTEVVSSANGFERQPRCSSHFVNKRKRFCLQLKGETLEQEMNSGSEQQKVCLHRLQVSLKLHERAGIEIQTCDFKCTSFHERH